MSFREKKSVICKRNSEFEGSSIKRMRLDDDILHSLTKTVSPSSSSSSSSSSSLAYSVSDSGGFCLSEEDNHRSSSISSGCSNNETNELATNTRLPFLDLEAHQISETEISALITNNFSLMSHRKQKGPSTNMESATTVRRDQLKPEKKTENSPTQTELDEFFSAAERHEQKRFTEKYNYDIVNDTPLEGRYQWSLV